MATDPIIDAVLTLLATADRDLSAYRSAGLEDPHRLLAGRAGLHAVEYAAGQLLQLRAALLDELGGIYGRSWDRPDTPGTMTP
jgi:hypothetical protein